MKPQRSAVALGVMVAALLVWLVVRSRVPQLASQPATGEASVASPAPTPQITVTSSPIPAASIPAAPRATAAPTPTRSAREQSAPVPTASASTLPSSPVPLAASPKPASAESASTNAIKVRRMITDYHTLTGENPVGTNAEIMAAAMGKNPRQATVGPPEGLNLNAQGELVDDWGTPYFFHQLSRDVMEIHSAGPDRTMGTADDVIVR